MTTTTELQAIVEELELIDIGDAASYLGEDPIFYEEDVSTSLLKAFSLDDSPRTCNCAANT
jgi:hypothetical protein